MSETCHICGPVRHEAPIVICAPCALNDSSGCADGAGNVSSSAAGGPRKADSAPPAGDLCARCGGVPLKPGQSSDNLDVCDRCDAEVRADIEARRNGAEAT